MVLKLLLFILGRVRTSVCQERAAHVLPPVQVRGGREVKSHPGPQPLAEECRHGSYIIFLSFLWRISGLYFNAENASFQCQLSEHTKLFRI